MNSPTATTSPDTTKSSRQLREELALANVLIFLNQAILIKAMSLDIKLASELGKVLGLSDDQVIDYWNDRFTDILSKLKIQ